MTTTTQNRRVVSSQQATSAHLGYFWLVLGALCSCFAVNGRWDLPLAAWFGPLLLLRFTRSKGVLSGLGWVWLVTTATMFFFLYQAQFDGGLNILLVAAGLLFGTVLTLPYLLDRVLTPRIALGSGLLISLVFPLSRVASEYLLSFSPYGSMISLAYTQYGDLPLLQVMSVTGVYGVTFLIAWFASAGVWVWEQHIVWPRIRLVTMFYSATLLLTLLGGSIRLTFFAPTAPTVRVASVSVPAALSQQNYLPYTPAHLRSVFGPINAYLLAQSLSAAQAGARIVVWSEKDALTLSGDESDLIERGQNLARAAHIYLDMGVKTLQVQDASLHLLHNQAILIDPQGNVVWIYNKTHPVPGLERVAPGDGQVPVVGTPYGRLATVICFDADFPDLMRQAGVNGTDIMLVPALDWPGIDPWHAQHATYRAIENGYSLVRGTSQGLAMTVDYEGRVLAATDYFTTDQQTMFASVPTAGVWTPYAHVGDLFTWLCIAGLLLLAVSVVLTAGKRRSEKHLE